MKKEKKPRLDKSFSEVENAACPVEKIWKIVENLAGNVKLWKTGCEIRKTM